MPSRFLKRPIMIQYLMQALSHGTTTRDDLRRLFLTTDDFGWKHTRINPIERLTDRPHVKDDYFGKVRVNSMMGHLIRSGLAEKRHYWFRHNFRWRPEILYAASEKGLKEYGDFISRPELVPLGFPDYKLLMPEIAATWIIRRLLRERLDKQIGLVGIYDRRSEIREAFFHKKKQRTFSPLLQIDIRSGESEVVTFDVDYASNVASRKYWRRRLISYQRPTFMLVSNEWVRNDIIKHALSADLNTSVYLGQMQCFYALGMMRTEWYYVPSSFEREMGLKERYMIFRPYTLGNYGVNMCNAVESFCLNHHCA